MRDDDPILRMSDAELDAIIDSWPMNDRPLSRHLECTLLLAKQRGHRPGDPSPIYADEPIPGCNCPECTGIPEDHPARRKPKRTRRGGRRRAATELLDVEGARRTPILDVVRALGLGEPRRVGQEYVVQCPLHDDHDPSLRINADEGLWYCDPCGRGGDAIGLVMDFRRCSFQDAVREIAR